MSSNDRIHSFLLKYWRNCFPDIHCLRTPTRERFTAFLRLPTGFNSAPVLEDVRSELLNPTAGGNECLVGGVETTPGLFALDLSRLSECGVRQCAVEDEEDWLCVMVRWVPARTGLCLVLHAYCYSRFT